MKGFIRDGKFHPIKSYSKVRKSRDLKAKSKGVKIRKGREQDLVYAESYNRGQNIKIVGHGNDWMLLVDRNVIGRATTKEEIFEMYDKVNTYPETGSLQSFDPRSPRSFRERKARDLKIDDRIETTQQISQEVLGEEKGTVLGRRFNPDGTISIEVVFDTRNTEGSSFVNPTSLKKIKETKAEYEQKQSRCPRCGINPRGSLSKFCDRCGKKNTAEYVRNREQEIFDMRVVNITRDLEKEGKSFKQIKQILQNRLGNRPKDLKE